MRRELAERWRETLEALPGRVRARGRRVPPGDRRGGGARRRRPYRRASAACTGWSPGTATRSALDVARAAGGAWARDERGAGRRGRRRRAARRRAVAAAADLGVTGVDLAIAETGTPRRCISGAGRPRSTSLLPAVPRGRLRSRRAGRVAGRRSGVLLEAWHDGGAAPMAGRRSINFITGPEPHRRHRADAHARRARPEGSARHLRRAGAGGAPWLSATSRRRRSRR